MAKAFGDMGPNARLRLIRDRFIAGDENCALRHHLDSVPPETPIRDIVGRCRVWEKPCRHRCRVDCETDTREGMAGVHGKQTVCAGFAKMFTSDNAGADTAASPGSYGDGDHAGTLTLECAGTAVSDCDYGNGNPATAPASGSAAADTAAPPGYDS